MPNKFLVFSLVLFISASFGEVPIKASKSYLYILIHGEDGRNAKTTYRIFTTGDYIGGLKGYLESKYNLKGHVFTFQMSNPSGSVDTWTREFGQMDNENCWINRARKQHKDYLRQTYGITDPDTLEARTPKMFIVFAHSFGGLAVRNYICSPYYQGNIKLLATINTPHEGTDYPHILEVMETRTAVARLGKLAKRSINDINDPNDITESIMAAFHLKKSYDSIEELVNEIKHYKKKLSNISNKIHAAENRLIKKYPDMGSGNFFKELTSSVIQLEKEAVSGISSTDPAHLEAIYAACRTFLSKETPSSPLLQFYQVFKSVKNTGFGNVNTVFNSLTSDELRSLVFSPAQFKACFKPDPKIEMTKTPQYAALYLSAYGALSYPKTILENNTAAFSVFEKMDVIKSFKDGLNRNFPKLSDLEVPAINALDLKSLIQDPLIQSMKNIDQIRTALANLNNMEISPTSCIQTCSEMAGALNQLLSIIDCMDDVQFFKKLNDFRVKITAIDGQLAAAAPAIALYLDLEEYKRAYESLFFFHKGKTVNLAYNTKGLEKFNIMQSSEFISQALLLCAHKEITYPEDKFKAMCAYLNLLKTNEFTIAPVKTIPASNPITIPQAVFAVSRILAIKEYLTDCMEALKDGANLYFDIMDLKDNISDILSNLNITPQNTEATDNARPLEDVSTGDALSVILLGLSALKVLGPAENAASSSAAFSVTARKLIKNFVKELWKEIQEGAILEVGFSQGYRNATSVTPSDPAIGAMSSTSSTLKKLKSNLPLHYPDTALNKTKYRIIYTAGVLTPTKEGTEALDRVCGKGGTGALIRAEIEVKKQALIGRIKDALAKNVAQRIKNEISSLSDKAKKDLTDGLKSSGDFEAAVEMAKNLGIFSRFRKLIETEANKAIEQFTKEINQYFDWVGDQSIDKIESALKNLEGMQKGMDFLDQVNAGMVVSMYHSLKALRDADIGFGPAVFSMYYSPLLKIGLYENGDFISTAKSQMGNNVLLFKKATDVKRFEYRVNDPLGPFTAISALGIALDAARHLVVDPSISEGLRLTKIAAVNILSIAVAISRQEEIMQYLCQSHDEAVAGICKRNMVDKILFDKPYVSIQMPEKVKGK